MGKAVHPTSIFTTHAFGVQGRIQDFFQEGVHSSLPINHIVFFCRIPVVLENRRSSQGLGGGAHPLHPPPRSAPGVGTKHQALIKMVDSRVN